MKNGKIAGIKIASFLLMVFVISLHSAAKDDDRDKNKFGVISWNKKDVEFVKAVEQTKWNEYTIKDVLIIPESGNCDEKYKEDFVAWLNLVLKKQVIPDDIIKHLVVYKDENYREEKRLRWDGFIVRFETPQYHFHIRDGTQGLTILMADKTKTSPETGAEKHLKFIEEVITKIFKNGITHAKDGHLSKIVINKMLSNDEFSKGYVDFHEKEDADNKEKNQGVCPLRQGISFCTDGKTVWFSFVKATIEEKYNTGMAMVFGYPKTRFESLALLKPELLDKNGWKPKPIKHIDDDERDEDKDKKDDSSQDKDKDKDKDKGDKPGQPDKKESLPPPVRDK